MPATFDSIAELTGTGSNTTLNFSSIPTGYTDLQLHFFVGGGTGFPFLRINNDNGTNYYQQSWWQPGTGNPTAVNNTSNAFWLAGYQYNPTVVGAAVVDIFAYRNPGSFSTIAMHSFGSSWNGTTQGEIVFHSCYWGTGSPVSSIQILNGNGGTWSTDTKATLYGILRA